MTGAIWTLAYDVAPDVESEYLEWFHGEHVPEKLARPGYAWAAHFRGAPHHADSVAGSHGFIAMFGGDSTRVFLDPSPAQLKLKQDAMTRQMMPHRQHTAALILTHEWSAVNGSMDAPLDSPVHSPAIQLWCLDAPDADETIGAWVAQELVSQFQALAALSRFSKFSNVVRGTKHALVAELADPQALNPGDVQSGVLGASLGSKLAVSVRSGSRIWPPPA